MDSPKVISVTEKVEDINRRLWSLKQQVRKLETGISGPVLKAKAMATIGPSSSLQQLLTETSTALIEVEDVVLACLRAVGSVKQNLSGEEQSGVSSVGSAYEECSAR